MEKTRKILAVCLGIAVLSIIIQIISAIINPQTVSLPVLVSTGIVPVVLGIALFSTKKEDTSK